MTRWTAEGDLVHIHPGVVMLPALADDPVARARAATLWARGPLSHFSALAARGVVPRHVDPIHVTVPADRFPRGSEGVVSHRTTLPLPIARVDDVPVVHLPRSLVDSWAWAHGGRRPVAGQDRPTARQAVIESVRRRTVSTAALRTESGAARMHAGRAELRRLLDLVAGGCQSELEIWGVLHVLPGPPEVPPFAQQHRSCCRTVVASTWMRRGRRRGSR